MSLKQLQAKKAKEDKYWVRLDVLPGDILKVPTITPILLKAMGKIENVIAILKGSGDKIALQIVAKWEEGTREEHKIVPFEAYCLAVKTTPKAVMSIIMGAIVEQSSQATELMLAAAHPDIVQKTIKLAKTKAGGDERKIVLQNRGTMPAPKNQIFNNYGSMDNRKQVANISMGQLEDDSNKLTDAAEKFNSTRQIEGITPEINVIDVTDEDV